MKRRKERLHTYVVKSEKVAPDVLETPWIGSSKYEVSFLYGLLILANPPPGLLAAQAACLLPCPALCQCA